MDCVERLKIIHNLIENPFPWVELSPRERQVAAMVVQGYSQAQIAKAHGLATGTVKTIVTRAAKKVGVKSSNWPKSIMSTIKELTA